jgi:hypothetical protein
LLLLSEIFPGNLCDVRRRQNDGDEETDCRKDADASVRNHDGHDFAQELKHNICLLLRQFVPFSLQL